MRVSGDAKWLKRTAGLSNTMCQGQRHRCHRLAGELHPRLRSGRIQRIFRDGLHKFLTGVIDATAVLGDEIGRFYMA